MYIFFFVCYLSMIFMNLNSSAIRISYIFFLSLSENVIYLLNHVVFQWICMNVNKEINGAPTSKKGIQIIIICLRRNTSQTKWIHLILGVNSFAAQQSIKSKTSWRFCTWFALTFIQSFWLYIHAYQFSAIIRNDRSCE